MLRDATAQIIKGNIEKKIEENKHSDLDHKKYEEFEEVLDDLKEDIHDINDQIKALRERDSKNDYKLVMQRMMDLKNELEQQISKSEEGLTKLTNNLGQLKKHVNDTNQTVEVENLQKRLRTVTNELDDMKIFNDHIFKLSRRLENVEAKCQDNLMMCEEVKRSIPPSSDHMMHEIKAMTVVLQNLKQQTHKEFDRFREDVKIQFAQNSTADLELKMVDRMNDVVRALTKQMADRHETKKNIRVLERQVKNVFEIVMFHATSAPGPQQSQLAQLL